MPISAAELYRFASAAAQPLLPLWLRWRAAKGKEDPARLRERYGYASHARPAGALLWLHAASVGEANSILPLIGALRLRLPQLNLLLTTGTTTSAALMKQRLPQGVIHQYVPLDTPEFTQRFLLHWRPEVALFVESELWPNLIAAADRIQCLMGIINGRMSARSFAGWQRRPGMIRALLSRFNIIFAQSSADAERYKALGARRVECVGNLKYDAPALSCDEAELLALRQQLQGRPVWLAASTHPGEEAMIAAAHRLLAATRPGLLTIIAPRHPARGAEIAALCRTHAPVAQRSLGEAIGAKSGFYIADTLGELGLFYRLSEIAFMGGSLVAHGGQNPLEPARLSCAIASGPHVHNFEDIYRELAQAGACEMLEDDSALAGTIDRLLRDATRRASMGRQARLVVEAHAGSNELLLSRLLPVLAQVATP
jgi:3-deoxy-D-manno-octulosonic-acid transferase